MGLVDDFKRGVQRSVSAAAELVGDALRVAAPIAAIIPGTTGALAYGTTLYVADKLSPRASSGASSGGLPVVLVVALAALLLTARK